MKLVLERIYTCDKYTIGKLFKYNEDKPWEYICDTLEDADRGLDNNMSIEEIKNKKIYGETAIPIGEYNINMKTISPKFKNRIWAKPFGGILPRLENVKGYEGVLIHVGNNAQTDSLGCILVGENKLKGMVINSTSTFKRLMNDYLLKDESNKITIVKKY